MKQRPVFDRMGETVGGKGMSRFFKKGRVKQNTRARFRLQTVVIILVAAIVVASVSSAAFCCYLTFRSSLVDQVAASRNDVLMQISTKAESLQSNMIALSRLYCRMVKDDTQDEVASFFKGDETDKNITMREVLDAYQDALEADYSVTLLGDDGMSYVSRNEGERCDLSALQKELWYLDIPGEVNENVFSWTQIHRDSSLGDGFYFSLARRVQDHDGKRITVLLNISERCLYQTYRKVVNSNSIYMVDKSGRIISSSDESLIGLNYFNMSRLDNLVSSGNYTIIEKSGVQYLLSRYDNIRYGVVYLEEIPLHSLLSALDYIQRWEVLVVGIVILLSCVVCWVIIHTLTAPLMVLCRKLERVSEGHFDTRFDVKSWREISLINDACAEMEEKISDLFENLREEEKQKRLAEIEFLQAQINPHFMYNTLFEIKCMVNLGDNDDAERMLDNFIAMLRTILSQKDELITLQEELVILQQYFTVMQCKYGDGISLSCDIPEELLRRKVLKFVLQPIVENSIFHGLEPMGSKGKIVIKAGEEEKFLYIQVEDNGVGMEEMRLEEVCQNRKASGKNTVGIHNVIRRIQLHFGNEYGVKITSQRNIGTKVLLILPILKADTVSEGKGQDEYIKSNGGG